MSVLQLTGSLTVAKSLLNDVGELLKDKEVQFELVTAERETDYVAGSFAFYIQVADDMNARIQYFPSELGSGNDDAYSFSGLNVNNTNAISPELHLPAHENKLIEAGVIDAIDRDGNSRGLFPVTLTLSVSDQGVLSSSIAISGSDATANVVDSNLLAQVAYWPINGAEAPVVDSNTADNLNQPVSAGEMTSHFSAQLSTINNFYNGVNLIQSWELNLSSISQSTTNEIANYARASGNTGSKDVFNIGEKIVAKDPQPYEIKIKDYKGIDHVVVSENVYGVVVHRKPE